MHLVSECHYWRLALTSPLIRAAEVVAGESSEKNLQQTDLQSAYTGGQDAETEY